jgi:hypothetical protein
LDRDSDSPGSTVLRDGRVASTAGAADPHTESPWLEFAGTRASCQGGEPKSAEAMREEKPAWTEAEALPVRSIRSSFVHALVPRIASADFGSPP